VPYEGCATVQACRQVIDGLLDQLDAAEASVRRALEAQAQAHFAQVRYADQAVAALAERDAATMLASIVATAVLAALILMGALGVRWWLRRRERGLTARVVRAVIASGAATVGKAANGQAKIVLGPAQLAVDGRISPLAEPGG